MKAEHALVVGDGVSTAEFACTCGVRGTYEDILRHVAEADLGPSLRSLGFPQRIIEPQETSADYAAVVVSPVPTDDEDFGGGNTKAHYLPNEPKRPAPATKPPAPLSRDATPIYVAPERTSAPTISSFAEPDPTPAPLPPTPTPPTPSAGVAAPVPDKSTCPICAQGTIEHDLPEITTWACGHGVLKRPRSIAESFQDMLRTAYQAGAVSAATGEIFETWYQREVLQ